MSRIVTNKTINAAQLSSFLDAPIRLLPDPDGTEVSCETVSLETLQAAIDAHVAIDTEGNRSTLTARANSALASNKAFLAVASPTNAQTLAQVKDLTRQNNAIIRLLLGKLDATD